MFKFSNKGDRSGQQLFFYQLIVKCSPPKALLNVFIRAIFFWNATQQTIACSKLAIYKDYMVDVFLLLLVLTLFTIRILFWIFTLNKNICLLFRQHLLVELCSKMTIKIPKWRQWRCSDAFIAKFEHISHNAVVFPLMSLNKYMWTGKEYQEVTFWTILEVSWKVEI